MLMDCVVGTPSFIQVNVSGGEPREVQDNVREVPIAITLFGEKGGSIIGAAKWRGLLCYHMVS